LREHFRIALQDYGRAVIIGGEHTHGKGTVQSIVDLDKSIPFKNMDRFKPLGALKLTTQKFYRISGESTQYRGVVPDILLPDRWKGLKSGEQYLEYALLWDTVSPTTYTKWSKPLADLSVLRSKSNKRVISNQDFNNIKLQNNRLIEKQKNTMKPLNIVKVRKEREDSRNQREKEKKLYHGQTDYEKGTIKVTKTAKQKKELWIKEINEDVYVQEAVAILIDTLKMKTSVSMN
jgi:carboxyl-terminal processing protease